MQTLAPETTDAVVLVHERNAFYRRYYRWALGVDGLCLGVIIVLCVIIAHLIRSPTKPLYFIADATGHLVEERPITEPALSVDEVIRWTVEAVEHANSYDFVNYRGELQDAQKYFADYGWRNYMQGLTASNNLLALVQRKMVFAAKVTAQPKLLREGILSGAYSYRFELPMLVNYLLPPNYDLKSGTSTAYRVTVIVMRQSLLKSYQGLAIVQMIATPLTQQTTSPNIVLPS